MARHGTRRAGRVQCMQVRLATQCTGEDYVTAKQWRNATLNRCPWHPEGGCGFCRHGTYPRKRPRGTLIPRWYCPVERRTVSALPDALAAHFCGTLDDIEAHVLATEQAASMMLAAMQRRTEIELPGALRYLSRVSKAVHRALNICIGLQPDLLCSVAPTIAEFAYLLNVPCVLRTLRQLFEPYLSQLPTPLGFNPSRNKVAAHAQRFQHQTGRDPPRAVLDPATQPVADRLLQEIN